MGNQEASREQTFAYIQEVRGVSLPVAKHIYRSGSIERKRRWREKAWTPGPPPAYPVLVSGNFMQEMEREHV